MEVNPWLTYFCSGMWCEHMGFPVSAENKVPFWQMSAGQISGCGKQVSILFDKIVQRLF